MKNILVIGSGAMGAAFTIPCLDNNHDINIVGTHLENDFIDNFKANNNLHSGLKTKISIVLSNSRDAEIAARLGLLGVPFSSSAITKQLIEFPLYFLRHRLAHYNYLTF